MLVVYLFICAIVIAAVWFVSILYRNGNEEYLVKEKKPVKSNEFMHR